MMLSPSLAHLAFGCRENVGGIPSNISANDDSLQYEADFSII